MKRSFQLAIIISSAVFIAAIISHGIVGLLKIKTSIGSHWVIGPVRSTYSVFMAGSSLAGDGLSWREISDVFHLRIEGRGIAGSSPSEWEYFHSLASQTNLTILVVSPYDLNEYFLSDFRAEVVPLRQTIKDLGKSHVDWPFRKRLLSQYPLELVRILYPTAGRSEGVMVGVREELIMMERLVSYRGTQEGSTVQLNESVSTAEYKREKISSWSPGRKLRRLTEMRIACQGEHAFNGPKKLAFLRMLKRGSDQGDVIVVVLPVSSVYLEEFMTPEVTRKFEEALAGTKNSSPKAHWVRLDQLNELTSNEYYWDLVHMNNDGRNIATNAFISQVRKLFILP